MKATRKCLALVSVLFASALATPAQAVDGPCGKGRFMLNGRCIPLPDQKKFGNQCPPNHIWIGGVCRYVSPGLDRGSVTAKPRNLPPLSRQTTPSRVDVAKQPTYRGQILIKPVKCPPGTDGTPPKCKRVN